MLFKVYGLKTLKGKGKGKDYFLYFDKDINTKNVTRARSHKLIQKFDTNKGKNMFGVLLVKIKLILILKTLMFLLCY